VSLSPLGLPVSLRTVNSRRHAEIGIAPGASPVRLSFGMMSIPCPARCVGARCRYDTNPAVLQVRPRNGCPYGERYTRDRSSEHLSAVPPDVGRRCFAPVLDDVDFWFAMEKHASLLVLRVCSIIRRWRSEAVHRLARRRSSVVGCMAATWLILPVVICLSQRLSHACLSINLYTVKLRMAH
jgi:hypothetical protein